MQTTATPSAAALKESALRKLSEARSFILSAREDLCNLEGPGYCQSYETSLATADRVEREISNLRRLAPPTGLFVI
jgi:hypothetical protein